MSRVMSVGFPNQIITEKKIMLTKIDVCQKTLCQPSTKQVLQHSCQNVRKVEFIKENFAYPYYDKIHVY